MSTCGQCGEHVPLGGGKTVRNATEMFEMADFLEGNLEQARDEQMRVFLVSFIADGRRFASWLHDYGHRRMDPPRDEVMLHFALGGEWLKQARIGLERSG